MTTRTDPTTTPRVPLTRERVLAGAVGLADEAGIKAVTMRKLAHELGVEAMSLYYHVANKEELLDGMVDAIIAELEQELGGFDFDVDSTNWKATMRARILTARTVMLRHPWAPRVLETRTTMSPQVLMYFDSVLGIMKMGGFSYEVAHQAMHTIGSRALGFNQEMFVPDDQGPTDEETDEMLAQMAEQLPFLMGMMSEIAHEDTDSTLGWCDYQREFEFGLDLILDGLDRLRDND